MGTSCVNRGDRYHCVCRTKRTDAPSQPDQKQARSIVLTSPTVATVGLSLTIPLAFLSDAARGKLKGGAGEVLGALAVTGGFFLVSWRREGEGEAAGEVVIRSEGDKEAEEGAGVSDGEWSVEER